MLPKLYCWKRKQYWNNQWRFLKLSKLTFFLSVILADKKKWIIFQKHKWASFIDLEEEQFIEQEFNDYSFGLT